MHENMDECLSLPCEGDLDIVTQLSKNGRALSCAYGGFPDGVQVASSRLPCTADSVQFVLWVLPNQ